MALRRRGTPATTATAQAEKKHSTVHWVPANLSANSQCFNNSMENGERARKERGVKVKPLHHSNGGTAERFVWEGEVGR